MPDRVVTVDLQTALAGTGAIILAAVMRPYNPTGLVVPWIGGHFVDAIVELNSEDGDTAHPHAWEFGDTSPFALTEGESGSARHTFLGWTRYPNKAAATPADPEVPDPFISRRRTVLSIDVGQIAGRRFHRNHDIIPLPGGGVALELFLDAPSDNANLVGPNIYDALDDHPMVLRTALQARGTNRRQNAAQPATSWNERRPTT